MGGTPEELAVKVDRGELDFVLDANATFDQVERYEADPKLTARVLTFPCDWLFAIPLNLALPPLDDVHVRRAVSLAMDKRGLRELLNAQTFWWGYAWGETIGHIASDAVTSNLLVGYDPYRTTDGKGNLARARREMALSRYDSNGDGVCDKHSCRNLRLLTWNEAGLPKMAALVRRNLARIGLDVDVTVAADYNDYLTETVPSKRTAMTVGDLWGGRVPERVHILRSAVCQTRVERLERLAGRRHHEPARGLGLSRGDGSQRRRSNRALSAAHRPIAGRVLGPDRPSVDGDDRALGSVCTPRSFIRGLGPYHELRPRPVHGSGIA